MHICAHHFICVTNGAWLVLVCNDKAMLGDNGIEKSSS